MKNLFNKQDIFSLKWKILIAVFSLSIAIGVYVAANYLNTEMTRAVQTARAELQNARTAVDQIEQEEATIIEYIGRFQELESEGIVNAEDRLLLLERITEIRENNDLFPISVSIGEQSSLRLLYDPTESAPGGPIDLNATELELSLPLLHENDLTSLLSELLGSPGLFLTQECSMNLNNPSITNYIMLGQHQTAKCNLLWFTFDVEPPPVEAAFF
ncbi:MAG: hypothetical protein COA71_09875 [SAR86 cluster bacterium]|uniref:Uncharacterized protein n=1 Tax=SAR86 cluster bacterium TaxID=2030880 RepID=A0A2A5CAL7_9GAMM|nr:MAG: hypothetical protein COA71_09875 [SAR86 cluster bacterium]